MKSLDLKQIGLQELTTVETRSVDGGDFGFCELLAIALYVLSEWDDISAGFRDGLNGNYNYQP